MSTKRYSWDSKEPINVKLVADLERLHGELDTIRDHSKIVISYNILYIYSNDVAGLQRLANLPYVHFNSSVRAVINKPRDVVLKADSPFKLRSYFKDRRLEESDLETLSKFFNSRQESYGLTPYFRSRLNSRSWLWVQRHNFIDHNDMKDITMLNLVVPGIIRKTLPIQAK